MPPDGNFESIFHNISLVMALISTGLPRNTPRMIADDSVEFQKALSIGSGYITDSIGTVSINEMEITQNLLSESINLKSSIHRRHCV